MVVVPSAEESPNRVGLLAGERIGSGEVEMHIERRFVTRGDSLRTSRGSVEPVKCSSMSCLQGKARVASQRA